MHKSKFEKLRQLRENKQKNIVDYSAQIEKIYDEVEEQEYNAIAKRALLEDDFVVDDNGLGYVGKGLEDWDTRQSSDTSESESEVRSGNKSKSNTKRKREKKKGAIIELFNQQARKIAENKENVEKVVAPNLGEQEIMGAIFEDLDQEVDEVVQKKMKFIQHEQAKSLVVPKTNPKFTDVHSFPVVFSD
jgi:DNA polymerase alpha subunit A